ncbi:MAG: heme exporter protein CcmB [Chitinophagaceae bacterium]|jgi:heme exporter protein B|nr:heme exporter protein CcmB [Chitinophagaceae bacterium]MCA6478272.1 heme exporter protein CcmB [Chitinophagaceae bacterium]MCA6479270.1 heme exporter protein CcmB [Chitinophagaceae bacterium]MCA6487540.1 heme exporter protein CcmB [Chitinophagaceae bacterium]MCA6493321.1 heme exporter protein CcmB [Chitinophagaceae bacterium]
MKSLSLIWQLVKKDLLLESRQQYTFYGMLLYVASTIFVIYQTMGQPDEKSWNGLFWIVLLFVCVNAVAKSFLQESHGRLLYFYTIAGARDFVLSKLLFNMLLMAGMGLLSLVLFTVLLGNPLEHAGKFLLITCLGGASIGLVFTFLAAIAARARQSTALMAVMGFPLIIPQLLLLMKIAAIAFSTVIQSGLAEMIALLIALDIMVVLLSVILFPFLWKD